MAFMYLSTASISRAHRVLLPCRSYASSVAAATKRGPKIMPIVSDTLEVTADMSVLYHRTVGFISERRNWLTPV
jgi:uncharacterized membrane protein SirB2